MGEGEGERWKRSQFGHDRGAVRAGLEGIGRRGGVGRKE